MGQSVADDAVVGFVYEYWRPYAPTFALGLAATVLGRLPQLLPALVLGTALDALFLDRGTAAGGYSLPLVPDAMIPTTTGGQFALTLALLGGAYAATAVLDWIAMRAYNRVRFRMVHDIRVDSYDALQRAPMAFFEDRETGDLMSVLNRDVSRVQAFVKDGVSAVVRFAAYSIALFAFIAAVDRQLAATVVVVPVVGSLVALWFSRRIERKHDRVRERFGALNGRLQTNFDAIAVVKAYAAEAFELDRLQNVSRDVVRARWDLIKLRSTVRPALSTTVGATTALVFFLGGVWILDGPPGPYAGQLTVGELFTVLIYIGSLTGPVTQLLSIGDTYQESAAAVRRIEEVTKAARSRDARGGAIDVEAPSGRVVFDDVTFTYDRGEEPALDHVSFDVEPGETIGIVGASGAGKSTLLALLMRFYEPDAGAVAVDGESVDRWPIDRLRAAIGYVSQDPVLFEASVAENVAYGDADASREDVLAASERAQADGFVRELPAGYDTQVGERGVQLSGGQRQRLAIARALYGDPPILIFDEATSHVDSETEAYIKEELAAVAGERTTFVVAHRLSTVRDADRIYVLDDGCLVESGTHDELVAREGVYARLWRAQTAGIGVGAAGAATVSGRSTGGERR